MGEGGTGASGGTVSGAILEAMNKKMFPDGPSTDTPQQREDRGYEHYIFPDDFTSDQQVVCRLPESCLVKWYGCYYWETLVGICVKYPIVDGGKYRVMCPVEGCNKEWAAVYEDQARDRCDRLCDHLWQKAYVEYGRNAYGARMKYPSPWWWFQMNVLQKQEELQEEQRGAA